MVSKSALIAFAIIVAGTVLSAPSGAQQVLKAGTNATGGAWWSSYDARSNTYRGVAVELLEEIGKDAGFQVEFIPIPFLELIPALTANKVDVTAANMLPTVERRALIDFSEPFTVNGDALVVLKTDAKEYKSIEDLKGMVIGSQKGSAQLAALQKTGLFPDIRAYDNFAEVMRDVNAGRLAAGIVANRAARYQFWLGQFSDLRIVTSYQPLLSTGDAFGVRKGDGELLRRIDQSLAKRTAQ